MYSHKIKTNMNSKLKQHFQNYRSSGKRAISSNLTPEFDNSMAPMKFFHERNLQNISKM